LEENMKFKYFYLIIGVLLVLLACKQPDSGNKSGYSPVTGDKMHMVQFKKQSLTDNVMLDSKQLDNKVVLLTFFATWCPPCIQEIPSFIELQKAYHDKGFTIVAFSVDEGGASQVVKLIKKHEINYPVLMADEAVTKGVGGVMGIPVSFLVNRKGEIVKKFMGYVDHDILEKEIKSLLAAG
jgi:thiol-disulfide isomerase/thioredoxin